MYFFLCLSLSSFCLVFIGMWKKYLSIVLVMVCCITKLSLKQILCISCSFWWSGIHEQMSWMAQTQRLPGGYSQAVGRLDHSYRISFEESSPAWQLFGVLLHSPLSTGKRPQFLSTWTSPQGCLSVLLTWQQAFPRASDPRGSTTKTEAAISLWLNIRSGIILLPYSIGHTELVYRRKGLHKAMKEYQEVRITGAILKADYHTQLSGPQWFASLPVQNTPIPSQSHLQSLIPFQSLISSNSRISCKSSPGVDGAS